MEIEELKALIALYERELESKEDEDKPLTDEEKEEIEENLLLKLEPRLLNTTLLLFNISKNTTAVTLDALILN